MSATFGPNSSNFEYCDRSLKVKNGSILVWIYHRRTQAITTGQLQYNNARNNNANFVSFIPNILKIMALKLLPKNF